MERKKFSSKAGEQLKYYVYLYIDPRDDHVFYVGKGVKNRCFSHLKDKSETKKVKKIEELRKLGLRPRIDILRYGLTPEEAYQVESAAIDLLGLHSLTNRVHGHGSSTTGRAGVEELNATLDAQEVEIADPAILININRNFYHGMSVHEIYDATRSAWKVNPERHQAEYAMSVYRGVIREVFVISGWVPGGSTMRTVDSDGRSTEREGRWEFVGQVADEAVRKKYHGRSVEQYFKKGARNPVLYVNC